MSVKVYTAKLWIQLIECQSFIGYAMIFAWHIFVLNQANPTKYVEIHLLGYSKYVLLILIKR